VLGAPRHAKTCDEITFDWLHTLTKLLILHKPF
jgi:hypothetical protein